MAEYKKRMLFLLIRLAKCLYYDPELLDLQSLEIPHEKP